jgi:hypothetical protein
MIRLVFDIGPDLSSVLTSVVIAIIVVGIAWVTRR